MTATVAGIHLGLDTHANRPAANTVPDGSVYSCSTHSLVYKSNYTGNSWATWATLGTGTLSDQGVVTYFDFTTAAAPSSPAAGKVRVYSKTGDHLAQKDSGGTETLLDAAGGGGLTQAYVGYNTVGGSTETLTANKVYMKKVTLANACEITGIEAHVKAGAGDTVSGLGVALFSDNAGVPLRVVAYNMNPTASVLLESASGTPVFRWINVPLGVWATAADYWLGVIALTTAAQIAFDTSGSDNVYSSGGAWFADAGFYTVTDSTKKYSIRANTIR